MSITWLILTGALRHLLKVGTYWKSFWLGAEVSQHHYILLFALCGIQLVNADSFFELNRKARKRNHHAQNLVIKYDPHKYFNMFLDKYCNIVMLCHINDRRLKMEKFSWAQFSFLGFLKFKVGNQLTSSDNLTRKQRAYHLNKNTIEKSKWRVDYPLCYPKLITDMYKMKQILLF